MSLGSSSSIYCSSFAQPRAETQERMKILMQPSILIFILLLLRPLNSISMALPSIITKPGCESKCGNTTIFYPFGMKDSNCFADEWFEVECRNGTKPYLRKLSLPLVKISVAPSSQVRVLSPVHFRNCSGKTNTPIPVNLSGSPFVYSQNDNYFVAVGCNSLVLLTSAVSGNSSGCASICDSRNDPSVKESRKCFGRYCCKTEIPQNLNDYYNVSFQEIQRGVDIGDPCKYAFIVDEKKWDEDDISNWDVRSLMQKSSDHIQAVMNWGIINQTEELPLRSENIICNNSESDDGVGWRCYCKESFSGNPYLSDGCQGNKSTKLHLIIKWSIGGVSVVLAFVSLITGSWFLYKALRKRKIEKLKQKYFNQNGGVLLQRRLSFGGFLNVDRAQLFSSEDIKKATDNFNQNRVLGKGGQGTVYKGMLSDGKIVAVKQFKVHGNVEEFINEVVILSQINHRNIVKLLGCCLETEVPLLVYEFLPNGTLFQRLHEYEKNDDIPMTWKMRLGIAREIAGALNYLHSASSEPIFHRDIKSRNILLDDKFRAKIADFGTSRIVPIDQTHLTTQVQGTFGYVDPEYFQTSQFTEKCDVYSFGVILAELLTGQKAISSIREDSEGVNLASNFIHAMEENHLFGILDHRVTREAEKLQVCAVANLAKRCLNLHGRLRPTMQEVTMELEGVRSVIAKEGCS